MVTSAVEESSDLVWKGSQSRRSRNVPLLLALFGDISIRRIYEDGSYDMLGVAGCSRASRNMLNAAAFKIIIATNVVVLTLSN